MNNYHQTPSLSESIARLNEGVRLKRALKGSVRRASIATMMVFIATSATLGAAAMSSMDAGQFAITVLLAGFAFASAIGIAVTHDLNRDIHDVCREYGILHDSENAAESFSSHNTHTRKEPRL